MARKTNASKSVHIVTFGHLSFAFESLPKATKAIELLGSMERVQWECDDSGSYYMPYKSEYRSDTELKLETNQPYEPRLRLIGLPAPIKNAKPCSACGTDTPKGGQCPACGLWASS
ncbi:hypothetical protein [Luteolibacter sp. LG18]|uniref:hypothetical protein n=1 Tax=Luteolibacter sp. LG18 TaxID=2819286 RepID=UPI002B2D9FAD|nr:hypothetical protein llg_07390 [Luteolibacter sp. LG18]BCU79632.1 hypothetical protein llg_43470 [Luteolibacter sp. LG18]